MSAESAERLRKISQELRNCTADVNTLYKTKASVIVPCAVWTRACSVGGALLTVGSR